MASAAPTRNVSETVRKAKICDCPEGFLVKYNMAVQKCLGKGMSGEVVLASFLDDPSDKRALKIIPKGRMIGGHSSADLFVQEVKVLQNVENPNVLSNVLAFTCPDNYVLCMPYLGEGTLRRYLGSMTDTNILKYFVQLTRAIGHLHQRGIVHRDIKPDNVMIDNNNNAILIDFGLACFVNQYKKGDDAGSRGYAAPELFAGKAGDLYKCDMYSLGVVFCNMIYGEMMHPSIPLFQKVNTDPDLSTMAKDILHHLLHPNQRNRWDIGQLVKAMSAYPKITKVIDGMHS